MSLLNYEGPLPCYCRRSAHIDGFNYGDQLPFTDDDPIYYVYKCLPINQLYHCLYKGEEYTLMAERLQPLSQEFIDSHPELLL